MCCQDSSKHSSKWRVSDQKQAGLTLGSGQLDIFQSGPPILRETSTEPGPPVCGCSKHRVPLNGKPEALSSTTCSVTEPTCTKSEASGSVLWDSCFLKGDLLRTGAGGVFMQTQLLGQPLASAL